MTNILSPLFSKWIICRGCLRPMEASGEAGLCPTCWDGLCPPDEDRCPRCALVHGGDRPCPDEVAWEHGDALWDYRGGRPPMGQLLVNGIKAGETGWRRALLRRVSNTALPEWARDVDLITSAPSSPWQRLIRGFDLAEEAGRLISKMTGRPYVRTLGKVWLKKRQAKLTESQRRRMPQKNIYLHKDSLVAGKIILLVDDVWTTGTTLLRCAQALDKAGAGEVRVLCLFRAC